MIKKIALVILALVGVLFAGVVAYRIVSPEIVVANLSPYTIRGAVILLPSNRISFGEIASGSENSIYYTVSQVDGAYDYSLTLSNGNRISGRCGYVTNSEFGKRLQLIVNDSEEVECLESNKIF